MFTVVLQNVHRFSHCFDDVDILTFKTFLFPKYAKICPQKGTPRKDCKTGQTYFKVLIPKRKQDIKGEMKGWNRAKKMVKGVKKGQNKGAKNKNNRV